MRSTIQQPLTQAVALLLAAAPLACSGAIIAGNFDQGPRTVNNPVSFIQTYLGRGVQFETGPTGDYALDNITLRLLAKDTVGSSVLRIRLYSNDGSDTPGDLLDELTPAAIPTIPPTDDPVDYVFAPSTNVTLTAGEKYWVALTSTAGGGQFEWYNAESAGGVSETGGSITGGMFNNDPNTNPQDPTTWDDPSGIRPYLQVNGSLVPEPASLALLGLLGFVSYRRRF